MGFRDDSVGLFWETLARQRGGGDRVPRALPAIPDTGWRAPQTFPNLQHAKVLAVDVETKDPHLQQLGPGARRDGHIVGLAVGTDDGGRWYFPMRHEVQPEHNLNPDAVLAWARDTLSGPQPKVGAHLLYDADFLAEEEVVLGGPWLDVQVAEPLLNENRRTYALDALASEYLGETKVRGALEAWVRDAYRTSNYRAEIWRCPPCLVGPYAEGDVDLPLRLLPLQQERLRAEGLVELFDMESGLLPMLLAMRQLGVRVDGAAQEALDRDLTAAINVAQRELDTLAGFRNVNVNARKDLERLFRSAGVPFPTDDTGKVTFAKEVLQHHAFPGAKAVLEVRRLAKYRDTFVRGYMEHRINGRIHTSFHPLKTDEHGTVSGRFASSDPNLQNIPVRDEVWGPRIRRLFLPEDGCQWVRHDWSQIEYRFLAHFGVGDNAAEVRRQYKEDPTTDFHVLVMQLTGLERKPAKNVNFGLVYGMGVPLLAQTLGLTVDEATRTVFDVYHAKVPFVRDTYEHASRLASGRGYVRTILHRRARFDLWQPPNARGDGEGTRGLPKELAVAAYGRNVRRAYTHKALNRVLQGSAADLMKACMLALWRSGVYRVLPVPHLTVHDELGHSVGATREQQQAIAEVKHTMETTLPLRVPVLADETRGATWGDCK